MATHHVRAEPLRHLPPGFLAGQRRARALGQAHKPLPTVRRHLGLWPRGWRGAVATAALPSPLRSRRRSGQPGTGCDRRAGLCRPSKVCSKMDVGEALRRWTDASGRASPSSPKPRRRAPARSLAMRNGASPRDGPDGFARGTKSRPAVLQWVCEGRFRRGYKPNERLQLHG